MSSLHRQPGRPNWFCAFRGPRGKQHFKSTGTPIKAEAQIICANWGKAARMARKGLLRHDRARRYSDQVMAELVEETGGSAPRATARKFFEAWLAQKENEAAESTMLRYRGIVDRFLKFLGERADQNLNHIGTEDVLAFRDELSADVASGTVNTYLKVLRVALGRAAKRELVIKNVAALVDKVSTRDKHERRAFTDEELKKLLDVADADWKTAILLGLYTGLRLGDIATLDWGSLDLLRAELTVTDHKTGRTQIIPIHSDLLRHLNDVAGADDPSARLCPNFANVGIAWLSNQFYDLMTRAKLVHKRTHERTKGKPGRSGRRRLQDISFHALRHTTTSWLKNAGVSDAVAMDLVGHESAAVSKAYTHVSKEAKRKAVDAMPDISKLCQQLELGIARRKAK